MVRPGRRLNAEPTLFRRLATWGGCLCLVLAVGCARSLKTIDEARGSFHAGDLSTAEASLRQLASEQGRFATAAELDLSMVELAGGNVDAAESRLRGLRDHFDALPQLTPMTEAASVVSDDTVRTYRPAGYEEVMVRAMLAVCSLAGDQVDAESYALQATTKQMALQRDAEQRGILNSQAAYQRIAIAPYLRGMLREATHHDYDDAARAYRLVSDVRPQFAPAAADIARASGGTHSAPGHGVLYVIACVGQGPVLKETVAPTTSTALSIASSVLNAETNKEEQADGKERVDGPVLPNIASVKVPAVHVPSSGVAAVGIRMGQQLYGATQTLTDVGELAVRQVEAEMPWTIARSIVRRVTKEAAVAKARDSLGLSGTAGSLFHFAAASAWSGVEHADTRCWGLLPREIQVFRCELPAGTHAITLDPLGFGGESVGPAQRHAVDVIDGRNSYLIAIAPGPAMYVVSTTASQAAAGLTGQMQNIPRQGVVPALAP